MLREGESKRKRKDANSLTSEVTPQTEKEQEAREGTNAKRATGHPWREKKEGGQRDDMNGTSYLTKCCLNNRDSRAPPRELPSPPRRLPSTLAGCALR